MVNVVLLRRCLRATYCWWQSTGDVAVKLDAERSIGDTVRVLPANVRPAALATGKKKHHNTVVSDGILSFIHIVNSLRERPHNAFVY